jgi:hypothetical protein
MRSWLILFAVAITTAGCLEAPQGIDPLGDPKAAGTAIPGAFTPNTMMGATSGQASSDKYELVFSVGGAAPPSQNATHKLNPPNESEE